MRALMVTRIIMMLPLANGINTYVLHSYKIIYSNGTSTMTIILIWLLQPNGILFASIKFADLNHFFKFSYFTTLLSVVRRKYFAANHRWCWGVTSINNGCISRFVECIIIAILRCLVWFKFYWEGSQEKLQGPFPGAKGGV